jgi:uncharacterized protein (UPF0332 family)
VQPATDKLLAKAERAAQTAAAALAAGAPEAAAGRAFYALLYAAKALLNERRIRLRAHVRIATALARLGSTGAVPLHTWLISAIERRRRGEAGELTYEEASELVDRARAAVEAVRARLR